MNLRTGLLWLMIASLVCAALLGIMAIILPGFTRYDEELIFTSLFVGMFSVLALACSVVLGRSRLRSLMWIGIIAAIVSGADWILGVWAQPYRWSNLWEELWWKGGGTTTTISIFAAHVGLLSLLRLDRRLFRQIRIAAFGLAGCLGGVIILAMWFDWDEEPAIRIIAVLAILTGCGTIVTPVLMLIEHLNRRSGRESVPSKLRVSLTCPRCGTAQQLRAGSDHCGQCGLRINIDVEEPRCACGYLLYQLTGDSCPECGREITEQNRWAAQLLQ